MTTTLGTNSSGDIYLDATGNIALLSGLPAVTAACKTASLLQVLEAIYQINLGQPTFGTVFTGIPNVAIYESYLRKTLMGVPGVVSVASITAKIQNNVFSYTAKIESVFGQLFLNG